MIFVICTLLLCGGIAAGEPDYSGLSWKDLEAVHDKKLFNRNLVKNGLNDWLMDKNNSWEITSKRLLFSAHIPHELADTEFCFASPTHDKLSPKSQTIDLIKEGFTKKFFDHYEPWIEVSGWFNSPISFNQSYVLRLYGLNKEGKVLFFSRKSVVATPEDEPHEWHKLQFVIKAYNGAGLRMIQILEMSNLPYPYRLKVAGTSVIFKWREISSQARPTEMQT